MLENQALLEDKVIAALHPVLKADSRVLDLGCGRGLVAINVYQQTGCTVCGINIDPVQVEIAQDLASNSKTPNRFLLGDFNLAETFDSFSDREFSAAYQIQSLNYAHNKPLYFAHVNRLLSIGGRFVILGCVRNPHYDRNNQAHRELVVKTKPLLTILYSPLATEYLQWLQDSGFKIVHAEDLDASSNDNSNSVVLYGYLNRHYKALGRWISRLSKWHILPRHWAMMLDRLNAGGEAWYEVDRLQLLSINFYIVAEKVRDVAPSSVHVG